MARRKRKKKKVLSPPHSRFSSFFFFSPPNAPSFRHHFLPNTQRCPPSPSARSPRYVDLVIAKSARNQKEIGTGSKPKAINSPDQEVLLLSLRFQLVSFPLGFRRVNRLVFGPPFQQMHACLFFAAAERKDLLKCAAQRAESLSRSFSSSLDSHHHRLAALRPFLADLLLRPFSPSLSPSTPSFPDLSLPAGPRPGGKALPALRRCAPRRSPPPGRREQPLLRRGHPRRGQAGRGRRPLWSDRARGRGGHGREPAAGPRAEGWRRRRGEDLRARLEDGAPPLNVLRERRKKKLERAKREERGSFSPVSSTDASGRISKPPLPFTRPPQRRKYK